MDADTINSVFPVTGIEVYPSGTVAITRECRYQGRRPKRADIALFSKKSLYRMLFLVRESTIEFLSLLTLTYPNPFLFTGQEVKKHLNAVLTWLRRQVDISYVWFLEFQQRGAPHYHVLLSERPYKAIREDLAHRWSKIVGKGAEEQHKVYQVHKHPASWEDIRHPDGAARYVAKYAAKQDQKDVPEWYQGVGRFWAASLDVRRSIPDPVTVEIEESELRGRLHTDGHPAHSWDVLPKYVFARKSVRTYL